MQPRECCGAISPSACADGQNSHAATSFDSRTDRFAPVRPDEDLLETSAAVVFASIVHCYQRSLFATPKCLSSLRVPSMLHARYRAKLRVLVGGHRVQYIPRGYAGGLDIGDRTSPERRVA